MYLRLIRVQGSTDRAEQDAAEKTFLEQFVPPIKQRPGFAGFFLGIDRASGISSSVSYWQDAAAELGSRPTSQVLAAAEAALKCKVLEVETFELVLIERAKPAAAGTYLRTNDVTGDATRIDAGIAFARDRVYPIVRQQPGFRSFGVAVNRKTGRSIVSTNWESMADLERSEAAVVDIREEARKTMGATGVTVEKWEIPVLELVGTAGAVTS